MKFAKEYTCHMCNKTFWSRGKNPRYCVKCSPIITLRNKEQATTARYAVFLRDDFKCVYCGASSIEDGAKLVLDHITPYSSTKDNSIYNIITSCDQCNISKNKTVLPIEVYKRIIQRNIDRNKGITPEKQKEINEILNKWFTSQKT